MSYCHVSRQIDEYIGRQDEAEGFEEIRDSMYEDRCAKERRKIQQWPELLAAAIHGLFEDAAEDYDGVLSAMVLAFAGRVQPTDNIGTSDEDCFAAAKRIVSDSIVKAVVKGVDQPTDAEVWAKIKANEALDKLIARDECVP